MQTNWRGKKEHITKFPRFSDGSIAACLRAEAYFQIINMETGLSIWTNTWKEQSDAETFCREGVIHIEAHAYIWINEYQEIFFSALLESLLVSPSCILRDWQTIWRPKTMRKVKKIKEQETTTHMEKSWAIRNQGKPNNHDRDGAVINTYSHMGKLYHGFAVCSDSIMHLVYETKGPTDWVQIIKQTPTMSFGCI